MPLSRLGSLQESQPHPGRHKERQDFVLWAPRWTHQPPRNHRDLQASHRDHRRRAHTTWTTRTSSTTFQQACVQSVGISVPHAAWLPPRDDTTHRSLGQRCSTQVRTGSTIVLCDRLFVTPVHQPDTDTTHSPRHGQQVLGGNHQQVLGEEHLHQRDPHLRRPGILNGAAGVMDMRHTPSFGPSRRATSARNASACRTTRPSPTTTATRTTWNVPAGAFE